MTMRLKQNYKRSCNLLRGGAFKDMEAPQSFEEETSFEKGRKSI